MIICKWMFDDKDDINKLEGMFVEINMMTNTGKIINKVLHSDKGDMVMKSSD
jgi:alkyl hydroperoxide reductase subunit AhpF